MEILILVALGIIAVLLIAVLIRSAGTQTDDTQTDADALAKTREENAVLETRLQSTQSQLDDALQQAETARTLELEKTKLQTDLDNEQTLQKRTAQELQSAHSRRDQLQSEVQEKATEIAGLKTQLENAEQRLVERGQLEKLFGDRFKSMSSETLANQQKQFLERATETLKPLSQKVDKLDREWATTSGAFKQQIQSLANETRTLSTALTRPQARGQWGEMQVERALELSGLVKGIHYDTQTPDNQGGRTDFIVHMPHRRDIILDSKVSLVALIEAQDTTDEAERARHLNDHARHMQNHADSLASKEYWSQLPDSADFVVMVVPEFALPPAVERRPNLIDRALQNNVVISTHSTLVALLKTVAMGWQERKIAEEANEIGLLGRELHDRLEVFTTHYAEIGTALDRAVNRYNRGVGSLESRVLTQARRFPQLGVQTTKELPQTQPIETTTRTIRTNNNPTPENNE